MRPLIQALLHGVVEEDDLDAVGDLDGARERRQQCPRRLEIEVRIRGGEPIDLGRIIDRRIEEIVDRKLAARAGEVQQLGDIDVAPAFDVAAAVHEHGDPHAVMSEWFQHEGREYPADFGVVFFQGWESYSPSEKVEAIRDAKKVLDRTLRKQA